MKFNYYFGFLLALDFSLAQYLFLLIFMILISLAFINFISFKVPTNYKRILYLIGFILLNYIFGGLFGGTLMALLNAMLYVFIREFSGDYS